MKSFPCGCQIVVAFALLLAAGVGAEEMVLVPKSRLQELERKAAELEKLQGQLRQAEGENLQLKKQAESVPVADSQLSHASPALATLPPLQDREIVNAFDLFNHYHADATAAAAHYGRKTFLVRGTVIGFEKPIFARPYHVLLRTADPAGRIVCKFELPDKFNTAFTVKNGTEMVAETGGRGRVILAKVGQEVTLRGTCRGLSEGNVVLTACEMK